MKSFIAFEQVGKTYSSVRGGDFVAVSGFDLEIEKGEFFCLLGPSGCGKSSVLSLIAGFENVTDGSINVDGKRVSGPGKDRCVVFQGDDSLYPWLTAVENVEFGLRLAGQSHRERRAKANRYLVLVGLEKAADKYPTELSGGMKQRIQIARALAAEPEILLMDEPFGALDAQTRGTMQMELRRIWQTTGATVIFITHDIDEAIILGTRVGVMTAGPRGRLKEIVEVDLPAERERVTPGYAQYYEQIHASISREVLRANSDGVH